MALALACSKSGYVGLPHLGGLCTSQFSSACELACRGPAHQYWNRGPRPILLLLCDAVTADCAPSPAPHPSPSPSPSGQRRPPARQLRPHAPTARCPRGGVACSSLRKSATPSRELYSSRPPPPPAPVPPASIDLTVWKCVPLLFNWPSPRRYRCYSCSAMPPPRLESAILAAACRFSKSLSGTHRVCLLSSSHCPKKLYSPTTSSFTRWDPLSKTLISTCRCWCFMRSSQEAWRSCLALSTNRSTQCCRGVRAFGGLAFTVSAGCRSEWKPCWVTKVLPRHCWHVRSSHRRLRQ